jgi:hypothetical protein
MGLGSWPLSQTSLSIGLGPWVVSHSGPSTTHLPGIGPSYNLRPGYVVRTTRNWVSIDGTPYRPAGDEPVLDVEGYYEIDIADVTGGLATRFSICIVDSAKLKVGMRSPHSDEPFAFRALASSLAQAYPAGRVTASSDALDSVADVTSNRAVNVEIRKLSSDGTYVKLGEALARRAGTWRSRPFALDTTVSDLKLAVVFAPQDLVLS